MPHSPWSTTAVSSALLAFLAVLPDARALTRGVVEVGSSPPTIAPDQELLIIKRSGVMFGCEPEPAPDAGSPDAGPADAGPADAGPADAGPADAGPPAPSPTRAAGDRARVTGGAGALAALLARHPAGDCTP